MPEKTLVARAGLCVSFLNTVASDFSSRPFSALMPPGTSSWKL